MRYVCLAGFALSGLTLSSALGQGSSTGLTILNYQPVGVEKASGALSDVTYRADILNSGPARTSVLATLTSKVASIQVVQPLLRFGSVQASGRATSTSTFTIRLDRSAPLDFGNLQWTFAALTAPIADAGPNQTSKVGSTVTLNGSASSNPAGSGRLSYSWTFAARPAGSSATLKNGTTVSPSFVVDASGTYLVKLTVTTDGGTHSDQVGISTTNSPPVANAGPNRTVAVGSTVALSGSGSSDVDGDGLKYSFLLITRPTGSAATLAKASTVSPAFVADKPGIYVVQLTVNDGKINSVPVAVTITTQNTQPVANPGANQTVGAGALVELNGAASTDVDGDALTYKWSLISVPAGSTAALSSATSVKPTFKADRQGTYVAQLIVNDGKTSSVPKTVTVSTNAVQAPSANAGPNQTVKHGSLVTLNGSGTDPQKLSVSFRWSLATKPEGSAASLSVTSLAKTTFVADVPGTYVAQLVVNNGSLNSSPALVTITTTNTKPVAEPGPDQSVAIGSLVTINGSGSTDADGDPLTYSFTFTSRPDGSNAVLSAAGSPSPTFFPDIPGTYVVQLIVGDRYASSDPQTVSITAANRGKVILGANIAVPLGQSGPFPVTLSVPAPPGGTTVMLTSTDASTAPVSVSSVFIPQGATEPATQPQLKGSNLGSTVIRASAPSYDSAASSVLVIAALTFTSPSLTIDGVDTKYLQLGLSAPAPIGGLTAIVASDDTRTALTPGTVTIPPGATFTVVPVTSVSPGTARIRASAPYAGDAIAEVTVKAVDIFLPSNMVVGPGEANQFPISLAKPSEDVTFIALSSSDESKATFSVPYVFVKAGQTEPVAQPKILGHSKGVVTITATAPGLRSASTTAQVGVTLAFLPSPIAFSGTGTQKVLLSLSGPAPQAGLTVSLSSSNSGVVHVPSSVSFGASTTSVAVPVTGIAPGSAVLRATVANLAEATAAVTVSGPATVIIPASTVVPVGRTVTFPVGLSKAAPAGGVIVALSSSETSTVTVSAKEVAIPAGRTEPLTQPTVTGVRPGFADLSAAAAGYATVRRTVEVSLAPAQIIAFSGAPQTAKLNTTFAKPFIVLVKDVSGIPIPGAVVTFAAPSSGPGGSFADGVTTAVTDAFGLATSAVFTANGTEGTYTVNVSIPGVNSVARFSVTNVNGALPNSIAITPAVVGQNLQTAVSLSLPEPAPAGGLRVTVSSEDPQLLLVAGRPGDTGGPQITLVIGEGITTISGIYVQGLSSSGTVQLTASASNLISGAAAITLAPSGVVLIGPSGISPRNFTTSLGNSTELIVEAARLDQALNYVETQAVRGGYSAAVKISNSQGVTAVMPDTVTLSGGHATAVTTFNALSVGSTTLTADIPSGFNTPAGTAHALTATVISSSLMPENVRVGQNLQTTASVKLSAPAPTGGLTVVVTSGDSKQVLLSASSQTAGSASITLPVQAGRTSTQEFYVQGLGSSGSVTYTATSAGFGSGSGTVSLGPSTFVLNGPFGLGIDFVTTTGAEFPMLTIYPALVQSTGELIEFQQVQGGLSVDVPVSSSVPSVGTIVKSPVKLTGGSGSATTQFRPMAAGSTIIQAETVAGFAATSRLDTITANVRSPGLHVSQSLIIGKSLQSIGTVLLSEPAPPSGLLITLNTNSNLIRLARSAADAGSNTITFAVQGGETSAIYYVQAFADTGSATYTARAIGFAPITASVTFVPSAFVITGPMGVGSSLLAPLSGGDQPVRIYAVLRNPETGEFDTAQPLAGGQWLPLTLTNSNPAAGTIPSAVTLSGGADNLVVPFTPLSNAITTVSVVTPPGFAPSGSLSLSVAVTD